MMQYLAPQGSMGTPSLPRQQSGTVHHQRPDIVNGLSSQPSNPLRSISSRSLSQNGMLRPDPQRTTSSPRYAPGVMPMAASIAPELPKPSASEFPDFNLLPAKERAGLKMCLVLAARQGMVDFSTLPWCPPWLHPPPFEARPPPQDPGRLRQDSKGLHPLLNLERQHSQASQHSPLSHGSHGSQHMEQGTDRAGSAFTISGRLCLHDLRKAEIRVLTLLAPSEFALIRNKLSRCM